MGHETRTDVDGRNAPDSAPRGAVPRVCEYLRTHSLADLHRDHGVKASVGTRAYKASFNYDQLAARDDDPLACECRGLVLATPDGSPFRTVGVVGETVVLARPMDRFFNHGQGAAHALDLAHPDTRVFEKLDGTLCIVYYDPHAREWCVATRAVPDADRAIDGFGEHTFRSLFEHALDAMGTSFAELTEWIGEHATWCFELTTPHNRVVVDHREARVHLLAIRDTATGEEQCPLVLDGPPAWFPVPAAPSYPTDDLDALLALVASRPPTESEGVVVRMPGFRRVKVKSAAYVAASRLTESVGASPRSLLTVILARQYDDVAPLLATHLRAHGDRLRERLAATCARFDADYERVVAEARGQGNERKALALAAQRDGLWLAPVMARYTGQCDSLAGYLARNRRDTGWATGFLDTVLHLLGERAESEAA